MSTTTTLITFRVRAPRSTRTLDLYGSWDNFSTSYSMSRDLQIGSEYWSGCFNFSNIICDGKPGDVIRPREGGLKMGGTYWYHYKLDEDIDFHNVCERATTNCPMMPGQLINVLHVPYAFSGNRSRNPSTSSTSSERRTMNPKDKFMNPRPAPAKPELVRLNTSPTLKLFADDKSVQPASEYTDNLLNASKLFRLAKKASLDSCATPNTRSGGLRAAFGIRSTRSQSPDEKTRERNLQCENPTRRNETDTSSVTGPTTPTQRGLLLRSFSDETIPTLSFKQHRQKRSQSRELPALQQETTRPIPSLVFTSPKKSSLSTVAEVASAGSSPDKGTTRELRPNLEKRLPTLPNTPSSAYPVSLLDKSPPRHLDLDNLESHFSTTTIDTTPNVLSLLSVNEQSHFSTWTDATNTTSIFVDDSIPLPVHEPFDFLSSPIDDKSFGSLLRNSLSYTSMSSSISTTPSTSFMDTDAEFEAAALSASLEATHKVPHYSLPEDDFASTATLKAQPEEILRGRTGNPAFYRQVVASPPSEEIIHSEGMRRLLDELSYLSGMIQH